MALLNTFQIPFPLIDANDNDDEHPTVKIYNPRRMDEKKNFKQLFRFNTENVGFLVNTFMNSSYEETRGGALTNKHKMKSFLRYIGDPGFQVGVGEDLGIHQTTVCKTIWDVCEMIVSKAGDWIRFPESNEEMESEKRKWQQNYLFPCVIGAIDCTHIFIKKPHSYPDEFVNRKGLFSFNVQATCNSKEQFTSVECEWAGSVHDSRIWRNSIIHQILRENEAGAILLADAGYPLTPWVMTPFKNTSTEEQRIYNILHKKERVVIERVFGQLKQRFPILQSKIRVKTERVPKLIVACFVLHNIAKFLNDEDDFDPFEGGLPEIPVEPVHERLTTDLERGKRRRNCIANFIRNR